jgi:hypothetical protein
VRACGRAWECVRAHEKACESRRRVGVGVCVGGGGGGGRSEVPERARYSQHHWPLEVVKAVQCLGTAHLAPPVRVRGDGRWEMGAGGGALGALGGTVGLGTQWETATHARREGNTQYVTRAPRPRGPTLHQHQHQHTRHPGSSSRPPGGCTVHFWVLRSPRPSTPHSAGHPPRQLVF